MPKYDNPKPERIHPIRITSSQSKAIKDARANYRKRTGENITEASIGREGYAKFCADNGVAWPQEGGKS